MKITMPLKQEEVLEYCDEPLSFLSTDEEGRSFMFCLGVGDSYLVAYIEEEDLIRFKNGDISTFELFQISEQLFKATNLIYDENNNEYFNVDLTSISIDDITDKELPETFWDDSYYAESNI